MIKTLNLGCGTLPFISPEDSTIVHNVDCIDLTQEQIGKANYVKHDLLTVPYPFDFQFDEIWLFHVIEHIPEQQHIIVLGEAKRLLKPGGRILITYPEFIKVAANYAKDKDGRRDYWKQCIYGRGWTEADRHKALMDTPFFIKFLNTIALDVALAKPEKTEPYNTIVVAVHGEQRLSYETLMAKEFK